jgi:sec-independent protein translocase protein TatA
MMFGLGPWEWVLIFAVVLLLFGGKKLPEFARGLGSSIREFQEALRGEKKTMPAEKNPKTSEALDKTLDG